MKRQFWSGAIALMLLAACGGSATPTSTSVPVTEATSTVAATVTGMETAMAVPPAATATTPVPTSTTEPTMLADATTTDMVEMTAEPTTRAMDSTTGPVAAGNPGDSAAQQMILNAMRKQFTGGPFRSETSIESNGQAYTVQGEFIPPSRMRATSAMGGVSTDMIIIEDKMWTKTGDQWTEVPGGGMNISQMMGDMLMDPEANGLQIINARSAGTEDVNGVNAAVYTYDSVYTLENQSISSTGKIWIDASSGLPIKSESEGAANGITTKTTQTITYDSRITIEPPTQ